MKQFFKDLMERPAHPVVIFVAAIAALLLIFLYGRTYVADGPHAVGFMNGREMTKEEGAAMAAGMRGGAPPKPASGKQPTPPAKAAAGP